MVARFRGTARSCSRLRSDRRRKQIADRECLGSNSRAARGAPDLITSCFEARARHICPIRSISTNVSRTNSPVVPTVVRAGGTLKYSLPDLVESGEVVEVGHEDLRLHHLVERTAGRLERPFEIPEDVFGLQLDVRAVEREVLAALGLGGNAGLEVAGELAGGENQIAERNASE